MSRPPRANPRAFLGRIVGAMFMRMNAKCAHPGAPTIGAGWRGNMERSCVMVGDARRVECHSFRRRSILDVACGTGENARHLAATHGFDVDGRSRRGVATRDGSRRGERDDGRSSWRLGTGSGSRRVYWGVASRRSQTASGRHVPCPSPSWCGCPPQAADQCPALPSRSLVLRPVRPRAMLVQARPYASCLARLADTIYSSLRRGSRRRP